MITRNQKTLIIILLITTCFVIGASTGYSMFMLSSYDNNTNLGQVQGSYYSISTGWLSLSATNKLTGTTNVLTHSGNVPNIIVDPDGNLVGGADIKLSLGVPYRTDVYGNRIDPYSEAEQLMARKIDDYVYVFELLHYSLDVNLRTIADVMITNDPLMIRLVDNNWEWGGCHEYQFFPRKQVTVETDWVSATANLYISCTPWTIDANTVVSEDGTVQYYYNDSWMGVLGCRLTQIPKMSQIDGSDIYQNTGLNEKDALPVSTSACAVNIQYANEETVEYQGMDLKWNDLYGLTAETVGQSIHLYDIDGSINNRVFAPDLALTNAPSEAMVYLNAELKAGAQYYRDWVKYNYYIFYPYGYPVGFLPAGTFQFNSEKYIDYLIGGRARNVQVTYKLTFSICSVGKYSFVNTSYLPNNIPIDVPNDLVPKVGLYGTTLNNTYYGPGNYAIDQWNQWWGALANGLNTFWQTGGLWNILLPIIILVGLVAVIIIVIKVVPKRRARPE